MISNLLKTLDGVRDIAKYESTDAEYIRLETAYKGIKAQMIKHYKRADCEQIDALIDNDLSADLTMAQNTFDAD